jgi:hypothetical protein
LADHLDKKGYHREANYIDKMLKSAGTKINLIPKDPAWVKALKLGRKILSPAMIGLEVFLEAYDPGQPTAASWMDECTNCHWQSTMIYSTIDFEASNLSEEDWSTWPVELKDLLERYWKDCCKTDYELPECVEHGVRSEECARANAGLTDWLGQKDRMAIQLHGIIRNNKDLKFINRKEASKTCGEKHG